MSNLSQFFGSSLPIGTPIEAASTNNFLDAAQTWKKADGTTLLKSAYPTAATTLSKNEDDVSNIDFSKMNNIVPADQWSNWQSGAWAGTYGCGNPTYTTGDTSFREYNSTLSKYVNIRNIASYEYGNTSTKLTVPSEIYDSSDEVTWSKILTIPATRVPYHVKIVGAYTVIFCYGFSAASGSSWFETGLHGGGYYYSKDHVNWNYCSFCRDVNYNMLDVEYNSIDGSYHFFSTYFADWTTNTSNLYGWIWRGKTIEFTSATSIAQFNYSGTNFWPYNYYGRGDASGNATPRSAILRSQTNVVLTVGSCTTAGTTTLTTSANFDSLQVGMMVTGTNIAAGTYITAIASSTSLTLSTSATGSTSGLTITFTMNNIVGTWSWCSSLSGSASYQYTYYWWYNTTTGVWSAPVLMDSLSGSPTNHDGSAFYKSANIFVDNQYVILSSFVYGSASSNMVRLAQSSNFGRTWTDISGQFTANYTPFKFVKVNATTYYALVYRNINLGATTTNIYSYKTTNNGLNWSNLYFYPPSQFNSNGPSYSIGTYTISAFSSANNGSGTFLLKTGSGGYLYSNDYGVTTRYISGFTSIDTVSYVAATSLWFMHRTNATTMSHSTDALAWVDTTLPAGNTYWSPPVWNSTNNSYFTIGIDATTTVAAYMANSTPTGTWTTVTMPSAQYSNPVWTGTYWVVTKFGTTNGTNCVLYATDANMRTGTWSTASMTVTNNNYNLFYVNSKVIALSNTGGAYMRYSNDNGVTWTNIASFIDGDAATSDEFFKFVWFTNIWWDSTKSKYMATSDNSVDNYNFKIYSSSDLVTWNLVTAHSVTPMSPGYAVGAYSNTFMNGMLIGLFSGQTGTYGDSHRVYTYTQSSNYTPTLIHLKPTYGYTPHMIRVKDAQWLRLYTFNQNLSGGTNWPTGDVGQSIVDYDYVNSTSTSLITKIIYESEFLNYKTHVIQDICYGNGMYVFSACGADYESGITYYSTTDFTDVKPIHHHQIIWTNASQMWYDECIIGKIQYSPTEKLFVFCSSWDVSDGKQTWTSGMPNQNGGYYAWSFVGSGGQILSIRTLSAASYNMWYWNKRLKLWSHYSVGQQSVLDANVQLAYYPQSQVVGANNYVLYSCGSSSNPGYRYAWFCTNTGLSFAVVGAPSYVGTQYHSRTVADTTTDGIALYTISKNGCITRTSPQMNSSNTYGGTIYVPSGQELVPTWTAAASAGFTQIRPMDVPNAQYMTQNGTVQFCDLPQTPDSTTIRRTEYYNSITYIEGVFFVTNFAGDLFKSTNLNNWTKVKTNGRAVCRVTKQNGKIFAVGPANISCIGAMGYDIINYFEVPHIPASKPDVNVYIKVK